MSTGTGAAAVLWGVAFLLFLNPGTGCPSACQCSARNRTVRCDGRELEAAPRGVPAGTRTLDLSRNLIRSLGRGHWARAGAWSRRLEDLDLGYNLLSQLEPGSFQGLDRLRALNLQGNRLRFLEPGALGGLPALTSLDLGDNPLVALLDHGLGGPGQLRVLALGAPSLVHIGPEAFSGLGSLQQLTVSASAVGQAPADALGRPANLTALRLRGWRRPGSVPDGWLRDLVQLRALELDGWPALAELGPGSLQGLVLVWLSVTRCNLSEVPYAGLRLQAQLRFLNLSYNPIRAVRAALLHHARRLQELRLLGGQLVTVAPGAFRGLPGLRLLDVADNQLTSLEQAAFRTVAALQSLGLGGNPLACDCRLLWVVRRRRRLRFLGAGPVCASPEGLRGLRLDGPEVEERLPAGAFRCRSPVIRGKEPPQRLRVREAQSVGLRCAADGQPPPRIVWLNPRRQVLVPGPGPSSGPGAGRSRLLPDGTLHISGVRPADAGTYRCVARNAGGNDTASAVLLVRPLSARELGLGAAGVPDPPLGRRALLTATGLGLCSFLGVVGLCFSLLLAWSRICGPIRHNTHIDFVPHAGGEGGAGAGAGAGAGGDGRFNVKVV
ncbi:leucine-rich repeat and immunoglobulin-like domain-containing nogo receptor-interacting protein 3 [Pristis pectinata]|uniref:leucine-rich repeat and immunoglobulin-like domain-containing nogo receptor-interacting protein 3 n=1 Tax=Pristis pectinata TaxID=685728 RepID=UPI00223DF0B5|nr:leucine-rich repeat and immunoglobulin-like domain-containing nogo receptor-interacting protein 3 [Pristis pectinata]